MAGGSCTRADLLSCLASAIAQSVIHGQNTPENGERPGWGPAFREASGCCVKRYLQLEIEFSAAVMPDSENK